MRGEVLTRESLARLLGHRWSVHLPRLYEPEHRRVLVVQYEAPATEWQRRRGQRLGMRVRVARGVRPADVRPMLARMLRRARSKRLR